MYIYISYSKLFHPHTGFIYVIYKTWRDAKPSMGFHDLYYMPHTMASYTIELCVKPLYIIYALVHAKCVSSLFSSSLH